MITPDVLPGDALFDELGSLLPEVQVIKTGGVGDGDRSGVCCLLLLGSWEA